MLIQNNRYSRIETTVWIVIEKTLNTNLMIKLEICLWDPFDIIAVTPRGTLGLCCVHIAQLMTHLAIYTLPFTLQLCYKPLGTLQRVTKSQKVHISSHDGLKNFATSNLLDIGLKTYQRRSRVAENFLVLIKYFEQRILGTSGKCVRNIWELC